jgi:seryl-tRNA synthetase
MHDIRAIRENPGVLKNALKRRGQDASEVEALLASILETDTAYRAALTEKETLLARRNAASKEIGQAMAAKDSARAEALKAEVASGKERLAALETDTGTLEGRLRDILAAIPNIPAEDVPEGRDEHGNVEYHARPRNDVPGSSAPRPAKRIETGRDHVDLGEALGMMDFETAAKLSGSRFVVTQKHIARLERALGQFMLDLHTSEHGYTEVNPPILVKDEAMFGTAQLPKFREDQFKAIREKIDEERVEEVRIQLEEAVIAYARDEAEKYFPEGSAVSNAPIFTRMIVRDAFLRKSMHDNELERTIRHWLIPTAEVPLTNLVREKILSEEELPLRFTALTPCFRAEAGSAGRDTRGMLRQHQFNKVELVSITTPETSRDEHERMLASAETVIKRLGLHFRTMKLCTGDMGFASQKTYDIEVWLPGQNTYREISSCSVCGDFQARRMEARFRPAIAKSSEVGTGSREDFASKKGSEKNTRFVHTLNGSGVAVGRALIAVMENYQNEDGSITVPDALVGYMGGLKRIERA